MPVSHAVRALRIKRAELSGEMAQLDVYRASLARQLKHLDETLRIMDPQWQAAAIPLGRKRRWLFRRGELQRMVAGILREAGDGIDNRAIARVVACRMDWDSADDELIGVIAGKVKDVRKRLLRGNNGKVGTTRRAVS